MRLFKNVTVLFVAGTLLCSCSHKSKVHKERREAWKVYTSLLTNEAKAMSSRDTILTSLQSLLSTWLNTERGEVTHRAALVKGVTSIKITPVEGITPPTLFSRAEFTKKDEMSNKEIGRILERISKLKALQKKRSSEKKAFQSLMNTARGRTPR